jgi:hypothetical protein
MQSFMRVYCTEGIGFTNENFLTSIHISLSLRHVQIITCFWCVFDCSLRSQRGTIVVNIAVEKYLSTSLMDVDVHPLWFQVRCVVRYVIGACHFVLGILFEIRNDCFRCLC